MITTTKAAAAAAAALLVLTAAACNSTAGGVEPTTPATAPLPTPTCDPGTDPCTPEKADEQAETRRLQEQAEQAYRATFSERVQLADQGGATEPSPQLVANAHGQYLDMVMELLRGQKRDGVTTHGLASTNVRRAPGAGAGDPGVDGRLSMEVCEDNSKSTWSDSTGEYQSSSSKGQVFAAVVDGRVKIVNARLDEVPSCDGW